MDEACEHGREMLADNFGTYLGILESRVQPLFPHMFYMLYVATLYRGRSQSNGEGNTECADEPH